MKAEIIRDYGGPEVLQLEEVSRPEPEKNEVIIRVRATAVNPIDWKIREGELREVTDSRLPLIPGWDIAGEIVQVGDQVTEFRPGDEVYALLDLRENGGYAEFVRASAKAIALKPESLDFITAASVPMAALTAYQALEKMNLKKESRILIHGAAGAVGNFAIQFAYLRGAQVIALASPGDGPYLRSLGAEEIHSYDSGPFENALHDLDAVLDVIGGDIVHRSWRVLKPGGILISTVEPPSKEESERFHAHGDMIFVRPDSNLLTEIARLLDSGEIRARVGTVLPLREAAKAQEIAKNAHHRGKVVLEVD